MESNRKRYPEDDNRKHFEENQRIGRDIAWERGNQNRNEQYRSSQSYHNRNEGYGPEQTHYGARPDSAYRNSNAINYGNRSEQNNNFDRNDRGYNQPNDQDQEQERYNQNHNGFSNQNRNPDTNYQEQSSGERHYNRERDTWPERNEYKDDDYRFRSGNRGNWHAPDGLGNSDNDRYRNQRDYREQNNYRHQDHNRYNDRNRNQENEQGFFDRIGNSISNTWHNITNPDYYHPANQRRHYDGENRNYNRGYESGPRWANESDQERHERERGDFRSDLH